jgi:hypothetical protein
MRGMCCLVVLLLTVTSAVAGNLANTNPLTPKDIAEGWLLLFDRATTFGWRIDGTARVDKGALRLGGTQVTRAYFNIPFDSFELRMQYRGEGPGQFQVRTTRGIATMTESFPNANTEPPGWDEYTLHVEFDPATTRQTDRTSYRSATGATGTGKGMIGGGTGPAFLHLVVPARTTLVVHSIKLKPLGLKSIFNGKDLSGWHQFVGKGKKSVFSVNDNGELNLKNGPGDLQTEGQWGDFVLQLECLSNGKRLNSGVFFRCRPGEYQQGYEAQIHNGWSDKPKRYTVEEFDPSTHQLKDKRNVLSRAMDYGTGAIYRRVPARKEVAKDFEWFTMTVVAHANHFATWVNGVQQVDWTDNRPPNDNARNGFRRAAGPISLQGHDPTTDLSFRNLRIAALPAEKK